MWYAYLHMHRLFFLLCWLLVSLSVNAQRQTRRFIERDEVKNNIERSMRLRSNPGNNASRHRPVTSADVITRIDMADYSWDSNLHWVPAGRITRLFSSWGDPILEYEVDINNLDTIYKFEYRYDMHLRCTDQIFTGNDRYVSRSDLGFHREYDASGYLVKEVYFYSTGLGSIRDSSVTTTTAYQTDALGHKSSYYYRETYSTTYEDFPGDTVRLLDAHAYRDSIHYLNHGTWDYDKYRFMYDSTRQEYMPYSRETYSDTDTLNAIAGSWQLYQFRNGDYHLYFDRRTQQPAPNYRGTAIFLNSDTLVEIRHYQFIVDDRLPKQSSFAAYGQDYLSRNSFRLPEWNNFQLFRVIYHRLDVQSDNMLINLDTLAFSPTGQLSSRVYTSASSNDTLQEAVPYRKIVINQIAAQVLPIYSPQNIIWIQGSSTNYVQPLGLPKSDWALTLLSATGQILQKDVRAQDQEFALHPGLATGVYSALLKSSDGRVVTSRITLGY